LRGGRPARINLVVSGKQKGHDTVECKESNSATDYLQGKRISIEIIEKYLRRWEILSNIAQVS
jgi:hypothetical protein